jgi:hypothetical protein
VESVDLPEDVPEPLFNNTRNTDLDCQFDSNTLIPEEAGYDGFVLKMSFDD